MGKIEVRIASLPGMRVASSYAFGMSPEEEAWKPIRRLAKERGIDLTSKDSRTFGFDNPTPSPGSPEYGYEIWMPIGPDTDLSPPLIAKNFDGGSFAVSRIIGLGRIGQGWENLIAWLEDSPLEWLSERFEMMEELLNPAEPDPERWIFDLYIPIHGCESGSEPEEA
jgi:DNA gyrase inhibitor GyrI